MHALLTRRIIVSSSSPATPTLEVRLRAPDAKLVIPVEEGQHFPMEVLTKRLVEVHYERNDVDFHRCNFCGDALEIISTSCNRPSDGVRRGHRLHDRGGSSDWRHARHIAKRRSIFPRSHYVSARDNLLRTCQDIREELGGRLREFKSQGKLLEAERLEQRTQLDLETI